jgi:hypothetical protein
MRRNVFTLSADAAILDLPDQVTCAEVQDLRDWLAIVLRMTDKEAVANVLREHDAEKALAAEKIP